MEGNIFREGWRQCLRLRTARALTELQEKRWKTRKSRSIAQREEGMDGDTDE